MLLLLFLAITLPALSLDIEPLAKDTPVPKALYINCLQRTQTQQLLKIYLMIALNSSYKNPKQELAESIPKYDKRFYEFDAYFRERLHDAEHVGYLDKAVVVWKRAKAMLETKPTKENAKKLYTDFHTLVKLLGKAKVLAKKSFKAVGMTGGLCRDPLYISNLYTMKLWGVELPKYDNEMVKYMAHFNKNIAELKAYEKSTKEINDYVGSAEKAFQFFTFMYDHKITIPTLISKKADKIFIEIRTIKKLYGKMLK
jgi:hypothetical protein